MSNTLRILGIGALSFGYSLMMVPACAQSSIGDHGSHIHDIDDHDIVHHHAVIGGHSNIGSTEHPISGHSSSGSHEHPVATHSSTGTHEHPIATHSSTGTHEHPIATHSSTGHHHDTSTSSTTSSDEAAHDDHSHHLVMTPFVCEDDELDDVNLAEFARVGKRFPLHLDLVEDSPFDDVPGGLIESPDGSEFGLANFAFLTNGCTNTGGPYVLVETTSGNVFFTSCSNGTFAGTSPDGFTRLFFTRSQLGVPFGERVTRIGIVLRSTANVLVDGVLVNGHPVVKNLTTATDSCPFGLPLE